MNIVIHPTVCLVMIVRNEQHYIVPALESVKKFIDTWVILDSHSHDETEGYAKMVLGGAGIPGDYVQYDIPFRADAKRTYALQLASGKADYMLVMDADNIFESDTGNPFAELTAQSYLVDNKMDGLVFPTLHLLRSDMGWRYEGIIHEFPTCENLSQQEYLPGVCIHEASKKTGPRAEGRDMQRHYYDHALLLEREIFDKKDTLPLYLLHRYTFYLGQSYKDCGFADRALEVYRIRVSQGGWEEEVFYSKLQIAFLINNKNSPAHEVLQAALDAWNYRPQRKEAAHFLMEVLYANGMYRAALAIGEYCSDLPCTDKLFLQQDIYDVHFPEIMARLKEKFVI